MWKKNCQPSCQCSTTRSWFSSHLSNSSFPNPLQDPALSFSSTFRIPHGSVPVLFLVSLYIFSQAISFLLKAFIYSHWQITPVFYLRPLQFLSCLCHILLQCFTGTQVQHVQTEVSLTWFGLLPTLPISSKAISFKKLFPVSDSWPLLFNNTTPI